MARLTISLLGPFEVALDGEPVTRFGTNKERALLAYLAVEASRPHRREALAGLLWPEWPERSARTNLRNTLSNLRTAIGDREAEPPYLHITRETIQLSQASEPQVDVAALSRALEARQIDASTIHQLEQAVALYRGPFLEGFSVDDSPAFEDWAYVVRERAARDVLTALQRLAAHHEEQGEYGRACQYAWRQVELEPWQEEAHRELMRLLALSGQRSAALAQYEACQRALREGLDVEPGEETRQLYEQIRSGQLAVRASSRAAPLPASPPAHGPAPAAAPLSPTPPRPATLTSGRAPLEGERRIVTALLADVKGSTALAERIGTEDWVEIMDHAFQVLGAEIYRYGGEIDQFRGDGLVAFYGLTTAHEDDPERAVLAALAMQDAFKAYVAELKARQGIDLSLRIGVNTGEVIAATVGGRQHREATAMGRAVALASRAETACEPGTVLVAEDTYRLVAPQFEWQALGEIEAKGLSQPLAVYRPLEHKATAGKGRGIAGLGSPLVGRETEVRSLREAIERLRSGVGGIVTVVGEAGIGKSRLVADARGWASLQTDRSQIPEGTSQDTGLQVRRATRNSAEHPERQGARPATRGLHWVEGRCLSYATTVAYHLWLDVLRGLLQVPADAPAPALDEALRASLRALCPECDVEVYPYLARLLSLPLDDDLEAQLRGIGPEGLRAGTFRAVETLIEGASRRAPLVLVCEDLHWADPTSLELLERLLSAADRAPVLLLCILRPETEHSCWALRETAAREYRHRHTDLWLEPLSTVDSETLVGNLLRVEGLPQALRERILERAEGNPFFVEEILRSLMESGAIAHDESTGRWVGAQDVDQIALPGTLHGVIVGRIDRLPTETKQVLQFASVIGRIFPRPVLAAVVHDGRELDQHLLALQRGQMVRERARLPEVEYIFKHVLTQEAAYHSLLSRERRRCHRRTAEALETLYPERIEEQVGLLARHWEEAGEWERAVPYLLRAGDQAGRAYANQEAIDDYRRALDLLDNASPGVQSQAWQLEALTGLGRMCHRTGRLSEAEQHFHSAIELGQESGLDTRARARLYHSLGEVLFWQGRYDERVRLGEEGLALLGDEPRSVEAALMYQTLAGAYWMKQDFVRFREYASRMAGFLEDLSYEPGLRPAYLSVMDFHRRFERDLEEARRWRDVLERRAGQHHDLTALANAHMYGGRFCTWQGDLHGAISAYEQALEAFARTGDSKETHNMQVELGLHYLDSGDFASAEAYLRAGYESARMLGEERLIADSHWFLGLLFLCRRDWEQATDALETAREIYRELDAPRDEFSATVLLAQVCLAQRDREGALRRFHELGAPAQRAALTADRSDVAYLLSALEEAGVGLDALVDSWHHVQGEPRARAQEPPLQPLERAAITAYGQRVEDHDRSLRALPPGWTWNDPFGDCSVEIVDGLVIRAANGRGLSRFNLSAPRLLRPISRDWAAQTVCGPTSGEDIPAIGGLLLWEDESSCLCLTKGLLGRHDICFSSRVDGEEEVVGRGHLAAGATADRMERTYLRLERAGDGVRALCSADGEDWYSVGEVTFRGEDHLQIGVVAIGEIDRTIYCGAYPEGTAMRFESFELWEGLG